MILITIFTIIGVIVAIVTKTIWWAILGLATGAIIKLSLCVSEKSNEIDSLTCDKRKLKAESERLTQEKNQLQIKANETQNAFELEREKRFHDKVDLARELSVDVSSVETKLIADDMDNVEKAIDDLLRNSVSHIRAFSYMAKIVADYKTIGIDKIADSLNWGHSNSRETQYISLRNISNEAKKLITEYKIYEYKYRYLITMFPELEEVLKDAFSGAIKIDPIEIIRARNGVVSSNKRDTERRSEEVIVKMFNEYSQSLQDADDKIIELQKKVQELTRKNEFNAQASKEYFRLTDSIDQLNAEKELYRAKAMLYDRSKSNLMAIPYMAQLISDFETIDLKKLERSLAHEKFNERKKIPTIKEIRAETKELLGKYKTYEYQLSYAINLFPALKDILDSDFNDLPGGLKLETSEHDYARDYLSSDEWNQLSSTDRNQLALDRYCNSHNKSKWQIGRDYELYVGYIFQKSGYSVDYVGSYMGLEDLGRDLLAEKDGKTYIIQCKYWSSVKVIHEKHIAQLYGTLVEYCIENGKSLGTDVRGMFVTNIDFSDTAKKFADYLGIKIHGCVERGSYPMIKCNIGKDEFGYETRIYHLPFDQQYDNVKINKPGECFAFTVKEAEKNGFRRANKWFGNN